MTDLREKVALNMVNALRRSYGFDDDKNIKFLDEMQDRDADAYRVEAQAAIDTVLAELMNDTGLYDRLGNKIMVGNVVHWSDGGEDLPIEERIATRWDRIAIVGKESIMPHFIVIDSPKKYVKTQAPRFEYGNFIYNDTENHLTVVAKSKAEYHDKFKNAADCMKWVSAAIAKLKGE